MATHKPSTSEEEYFAREDAEKKRKLSLARAKAMATEERASLKALHARHCPRDGMMLEDIALGGVMVEKCFTCHGIFLGEDELRKLAGNDGYWSRMLQFFARREYAKDGHE